MIGRLTNSKKMYRPVKVCYDNDHNYIILINNGVLCLANGKVITCTLDECDTRYVSDSVADTIVEMGLFESGKCWFFNIKRNQPHGVGTLLAAFINSMFHVNTRFIVNDIMHIDTTRKQFKYGNLECNYGDDRAFARFLRDIICTKTQEFDDTVSVQELMEDTPQVAGGGAAAHPNTPIDVPVEGSDDYVGTAMDDESQYNYSPRSGSVCSQNTVVMSQGENI